MKFLLNYLVIIILLITYSLCIKDSSLNSNVIADDDAAVKTNAGSEESQHLIKYRKLLSIKLEDINHAVSTVKNMASYEKQYQMLSILMDKIFKVLLESKVKLTEAGYVPTDGLPANETILDIFSLIVENTYFMGRFALELPDQVHGILSKNSDWKLLIQYAIRFCMDSNVLEELELKILNLAAQELQLIPRDENYVNPNTRKFKLEKQQELEKSLKVIGSKKDKIKKVTKKGPKLGSPRHREL